jgi:AcrR family transcriptional regulator
MSGDPAKKEGLRERKRRETLQRIAEVGLKLFSEQGYEATTLEAIAEAAGISPRTFFYYFKTKDEVLQFWQSSGFAEAVAPAILAQSTDQTPLHAVRNALFRLLPRYQNEKSVIVDRILNSTETLRARKQAFYFSMEQTVFDALIQLWPQPEQRPQLRMVAMVSIGAMRLAMEARRHDTQIRPLQQYLQESFAVLESQIRPVSAT